MEKNKYYRLIPKVDIILADKTIANLIECEGRELVMDAIRSCTENLRTLIEASDSEEEITKAINELPLSIEKEVKSASKANMVSAINATGTILHTNLGRAPISKVHAKALVDIVSGYCNLEYNLDAGKRGERYSHFEKLLCKLTGAEAAMAVNNNASAVLLALSSVCKDTEVIVSRGELVEIGGKFRVPDVMEQSGATLVEVGTTNKTHLSDYEEKISEATGALLKVHTSNYRIVGFTESVPVAELCELAHSKDIPLIEDIGSGVLVDLSEYGLSYEPTVIDSIKAGADLVCFSGDKLLGGPQAGIIVGKKKYIDMLKKNQLTRALRIDKFTAAALELVFLEYLNPDTVAKNIPVLSMISQKPEEIKNRAVSLKRALAKKDIKAKLSIIECESQIGGGSLPLERLSSFALAIVPKKFSIFETEKKMRALKRPIIPRVFDDMIVMDLRCIQKDDIKDIAEMMGDIL